MRYAGKIDLFGTAWELAPDQYRDSPKLKALVKAAVGNGQPFEDAIARFARWADVSAAEGAWLDVLGSVRNVSRNPGETDKDYRDRFEASLLIDTAGTPDNVTTSASRLSGDPSPAYIDECPATFFVYTPGGFQLSRGTVRSLAPAGVLGLPGARVETAGGLALATADGRLILAAARDEDKEAEQ